MTLERGFGIRTGMTLTVDTADIDSTDLLADLIARARRAGADAADAILVDGTSLSIAYRLGELEHLERAEGGDLGLRVFVGRRSAIVSSADRSRAALDALVERAVAMARTVPEDPYAGLAEPEQLATDWPELDRFDPTEPTAEQMIERVKAAEDAARAVPGVTNSEGAEAGFSRTRVTLAASNGFVGSYRGSGNSLSASVIAGEGTGMETDYDFTTAVHDADLRAAEEVGRGAGERAVRRLNARKVSTQRVPVVLDPRVSRSILGHLSGAISGTAIARGTSFLLDKRGETIFDTGVTVVDDPHIRRGLRSKPFDAEGVANGRRTLIDRGVLQGWILDLRSGRQLGLPTTGNASRGTSGPPGPSATNLFMEPGAESPETMIAAIGSGLYVTQLMGSSVSLITGDYSRGASGFWIENGEIAYPVNEVTIAGNLKDMFRNITAANDLVRRYGIDAPTLRIDGMTVAGK